MASEELELLKLRVQANDPAALYEYSRLLRKSEDPDADKYLLLAAQLCYPPAQEPAGDLMRMQGNNDAAACYYRAGAVAGVVDCAVKLAIIFLAINEPAALNELEELAEMGVRSACIALSEHYKSIGNRKQSAYWRSLLDK